MNELTAIKKISRDYILRCISVTVFIAAMFAEMIFMNVNHIVITIIDGSKTTKADYYGNVSVSEVFADARIVLEAYDTISMPLNAVLGEDSEIEILRGGQNAVPTDFTVDLAWIMQDSGYVQYSDIREQEEREAAYIRQQQQASSYKYVGYVGGEYYFNDDGTITTSAGTYELVETLTVNASAYCPCIICCEEYANGYTADGSKATAGYTLATPSIYPFGTYFYIPYFDRVFEVEDRGGAIQGNRIDIYFDTHEEALQFGRQYITIYRIK